jgi:signal transduction histidine kinase
LATLDEPAFQLRTERVDLSELLADIAARFTERAGQQGVDLQALHGEQPVAAVVDVELFERAVANLLDNALKFCGAGSRITLQALERGGEVEVSVSDTGPGIAGADLPHLFDRFYQARHTVAPSTGEGGKGLGLAIVKRIVELHRGSVAVASSLTQGTRVALTLPASLNSARENP